MKRNKSHIAFVLSLSILVFSTFLLISSNQDESASSIRETIDSGNLNVTPNHGPFAIHSDVELVAMAKYEGWAGSGTINDPFIIHSLTIISKATCIRIENTNLHIRISKNLLISDSESNGVGISLFNVSNAVVEHNTIVNKRIGVFAQYSLNSNFTNNEIRLSSESAFRILYSELCNILENSVFQSGTGFDLFHLSDCRFIANTASQITLMGANFVSCDSSEIMNNTISEVGDFGLGIHDSSNLRVGLNTVYLSGENGFDFGRLRTSLVFNNTSVLNTGRGFWMNDCSNSTFRFNNAVQNEASGISAARIQNNIFSNNLLCGNRISGFAQYSAASTSVLFNNSLGWNGKNNAYDDSSRSSWQDNNWHDYDGSGKYGISGPANAIDTNPSLYVDNHPPMIYGPSSPASFQPNETINLRWYIWDCQPWNYEIHWNGNKIGEGNWTAFGVQAQIGPLTKSDSIVILKAYDRSGLSTEHVILFTEVAHANKGGYSFLLRVGIGIIAIVSVSIVYGYATSSREISLRKI